MTDYKTVARECSAEFTEKKSRFIGFVRPVKTRIQAEEFINEIRSLHGKARHNVYAYVLREENFSKYSDAGEPSGTAGAPVLDVINSEKLTDVCIVVTRYFGGILLGTGGLVRAYSKSAAMAISAAGTADMIYCRRFFVRCGYGDYDKVCRVSAQCGAIAEETDFSEDVAMTFAVREKEAESFLKKLSDATNGNAICTELEAGYTQGKFTDI